MKRRFTGGELFNIRNLIPIDWLIKEQLNIPSKVSEGFLRFLCPLCNEFQTATNPKTNLARCFRCETNFNPIDLVMTVKGETGSPIKGRVKRKNTSPCENHNLFRLTLISLNGPTGHFSLFSAPVTSLMEVCVRLESIRTSHPSGSRRLILRNFV